MVPDDTSGLDLFDETASAVHGFPQSLRGYDRGAVDAYVREVESQLARAKAQVREQHRQLRDAGTRIGETDYEQLGAHTRALLRAAEAQAQELVTTAEHRARHLQAVAEAEAERTGVEARLALDAAQASSAAELHAIRRRLSEQTAAELQAARAEGASVIEFARHQAAALLAEASVKAELVERESQLAAEARTVAGEREATEHRLEIVTEKEAALADVKAAHEAVAAEFASLLDQTRQRMTDHAARLEADALTWEQRREAAQAEAAEIVAGARKEAARILQEADDSARAQHADTLADAARQKSELEAEIALLIGRRKAIVAQLGELSALAGSTAVDYGDGEPTR